MRVRIILGLKRHGVAVVIRPVYVELQHSVLIHYRYGVYEDWLVFQTEPEDVLAKHFVQVLLLVDELLAFEVI